MRPKFALYDLALLTRMHEFDRIFEADDVDIASVIQVIDHRRQSCRLARSCRAGDQDHALMIVTESGQNIRHLEVFQCRYIARNETENGAITRNLAKYIDAKTTTFLGDVRKIEIVALLEQFLLVSGQNLEYVRFEFRFR